jgi:histone-lysine N-methyltransferase SETMAR
MFVTEQEYEWSRKFTNGVTSGDETWVHYHIPETKRARLEGCHSSSPKPKKFQTQPSAWKVMLILFRDQKGVILEHYTPRENIVTGASYSDLLKNHLRPAIKTKRCGLLSTGVILHHYNARSRTVRATAATIEDLHFECLPHPLYSPDLVPSYYHMFGLFKEALQGKKFLSDEEVHQVVHDWLHSQQKEYFPQEFRHFVSVGELVLSLGKIM